VLNWLPPPSDFRTDFRAALELADPAQRLERLTALAQHRLGLLETIQLERALDAIAVDKVPGRTVLRVALLGTSTADHLRPAIRVAGLRRQLLLNVHLGAYGQYRQELMDSTSSLARFDPQFVLLSLSAREAIAGVPLTATAAEVEATIDRFVEGLRLLWGRARETADAVVIQQTFLNVAEPVFGSHDRLVAAAPARLIDHLNDRTCGAAAAEGVLLLDVDRASARDGLDVWFDGTRWLQAKMEISPRAAPLYGELVARVIAAQRGLSRKCLVLDLDNTLWGGVIGDDGLDGIVLGEGSAAGEAYLAVQRYARALRDRGVILAVCSKNDPATAESVFQRHPEMLLKRTDIAAFVANWDDKAVNLRRIAEELNIGVDSLVFLDDNPAERARIRQSLPQVAVPELPADPGQYVRCLAEAGYFEAVSFTSEDQQRGDQYAANVSRDALRHSSESLDDFLRGLDMSLQSGPFSAVDLARVVQLINKTNQFNPTTRRHSAGDVERFMADERCRTLQFRLADRFGDNGLVSAMILRPDPDAPDVLDIDTWVMSCRVFGRQLEVEAMNLAVETARAAGARTLRAEYIPTAKNGVVRALYPTLGFEPATGSHTAGEATRWVLQVEAYKTRPTPIARRAPA
jgi:FkbH-like protein